MFNEHNLEHSPDPNPTIYRRLVSNTKLVLPTNYIGQFQMYLE